MLVPVAFSDGVCCRWYSEANDDYNCFFTQTDSHCRAGIDIDWSRAEHKYNYSDEWPLYDYNATNFTIIEKHCNSSHNWCYPRAGNYSGKVNIRGNVTISRNITENQTRYAYENKSNHAKTNRSVNQNNSKNISGNNCPSCSPVSNVTKRENNTTVSENDTGNYSGNSNMKNLDLYNKDVFIVSDKNWQQVLQLIPVTIWTNPGQSNCQKGYETSKSVCTYPTLIYHEDAGFDADSIIHFLQQYNPDNIQLIGNYPQQLADLFTAKPEFGAGINSIQKITEEDYIKYWQQYNDIVYVENNYKLSLVASTYASLINAPLVIENSELSKSVNFEGKNVTCVGNVDKNCNKKFSVKQLQQEYISKTQKRDKVLLVNHEDLSISQSAQFEPEKSGTIQNIYGKHSLSAPVLASAKHEIIISTASYEVNSVDTFIEKKISELGLSPEYLTIVAAPNAIAMSYENGEQWDSTNYESADAWQYSKLDADNLVDISVGRIFGLTSSDVSSNIARSLFYDKIISNPGKVLSTRGQPCYWKAAYV